MKRVMIDPPSGWKYGFPKELPNDIKDFRTWLIDNQYPEANVDFAINHCRMWEETDEHQVDT